MRNASARYVALLRGINVGGGNVIRMTDLKECFEGFGCAEVATYIQSGNVVFRSKEKDPATLVASIERALSGRFAYAARAVVLDHKQLAHVVLRAPAGFGKQPAKYRYDVMFLRPPVTATEVIQTITLKQGVDTAAKGKGVLYFSRLISKATQSHLPKIIALPVYQQMTIRNWNTTTKLLALMDAAASA